MATLPDRFPGAWQDIPPIVRRFLVERLRDKMLAQHEGPAGLIMWLFAGEKQADGTRVPYSADVEVYWQVVKQECLRWAQQGRAIPAPSTSASPQPEDLDR